MASPAVAAKVVVLGAGVSGQNAAAIALGMQAEVLLLDLNIARLRQMTPSTRATCRPSPRTHYEVERAVLDADMVIGAVLVPGAKAPKLISNEMVSRMKPGSVLVDIAIDQGGCFEDSRPTTHADPTYPVHNSVFYCVANMPGAVPNTSTYALTNVTLPYAVALANKGWAQASATTTPSRRSQHPRRSGHLRRRGRGVRPRARVAGGRARLTARRRTPRGSRAAGGQAAAPVLCQVTSPAKPWPDPLARARARTSTTSRWSAVSRPTRWRRIDAT